MFLVKKSSMLIVAALLRLLVMMVCFVRNGARSSYLIQNSGYDVAPSPKSSSRRRMGHNASTLVWNVAEFWSK